MVLSVYNETASSRPRQTKEQRIFAARHKAQCKDFTFSTPFSLQRRLDFILSFWAVWTSFKSVSEDLPSVGDCGGPQETVVSVTKPRRLSFDRRCRVERLVPCAGRGEKWLAATGTQDTHPSCHWCTALWSRRPIKLHHILFFTLPSQAKLPTTSPGTLITKWAYYEAFDVHTGILLACPEAA